MDYRSLRPLLLPVLALALALPSCETPGVFLPSYQPGGPEGILGGTVTYQGPLPCTENHHVVGAAVFLVFDTRLLPPPEGLGTSAGTVATVGGDQLFGGVLDRLTFNPDNLDDPSKSRWCPPDGTQVTVSASWSAGPLLGGVYEVRGFYDLHGQFDPAFSISTLPHQGDVAGGAIDNVSAVLMGAAPQYRKVQLGAVPEAGLCAQDSDCVTAFGDGNTCQQGYCMPPQGANIDGIAVTLGLPLATGLPIFYPSQAKVSQYTCQGTMKQPTNMPTTIDPSKVVMPADYTLPDFSVLGAEDSLIRIDLTAGVAPDEVAAASAAPFGFPVSGTPTFAFSWQDVNGDGVIDGKDHVAASSLIPALYPLSIFTELARPDNPLAGQSSPTVIIEGLTLYKDLLTTASLASMPGAPLTPISDVSVGVTPSVLCIDPADFSATASAKLVLTHKSDCAGTNAVLMDEAGTKAALAAQFGRPVDIVEGCIPEGNYAMHLIYPTGQAWTVPNEAGVCAAAEPESADGKTCVGNTPAGQTARARLASQDVALTIGPPDHPDYCVSHPTPKECCPALADPSAPRVDPATGRCKCPSADPNAGCQ